MPYKPRRSMIAEGCKVNPAFSNISLLIRASSALVSSTLAKQEPYARRVTKPLFTPKCRSLLHPSPNQTLAYRGDRPSTRRSFTLLCSSPYPSAHALRAPPNKAFVDTKCRSLLYHSSTPPPQIPASQVAKPRAETLLSEAGLVFLPFATA